MAGGGFIGFHCATDTFKNSDMEMGEDATTPYIAMIGGQFAGHGAQFEGTVRVVDPAHPVAASLVDNWQIKDEWYVFSHEAEDRQIIARLDPGEQREKQAKLYDRPDYPILWTREQGKGRVYYNAMGHREDVWDSERFQNAVVDAIRWAAGSQ